MYTEVFQSETRTKVELAHLAMEQTKTTTTTNTFANDPAPAMPKRATYVGSVTWGYLNSCMYVRLFGTLKPEPQRM
jgi:hypothetical protein